MQEENWLGVHVVAPGVDPVVECVRPHLMTENNVTDCCKFSIVAIHGLDGHPEWSWTAENGTFWFRDLLPNKIPHARILTYGYDANTRGQQQFASGSTYDLARGLLSSLATQRQATGVSPNTSHRQYISHNL